VANHAPTASGHDQDAVPGTVFALSTLFTYSEADGLSDIVKFDVQDRTAGGGYLTLNGVKQPENTVFERPTGEIGQWAFVVGPSGSDVVGFNAVDSQGAFNNPSAAATVTALDGGGAQKGIDFQVAGSISASDIAAKGYAFVGNYLGTSSPNYLTEKQANSYIQASLGMSRSMLK
jgi:hypothetical protein